MSKKSKRIMDNLIRLQCRLLVLLSELSIRLDQVRDLSDMPEQRNEDGDIGRHRSEP